MKAYVSWINTPKIDVTSVSDPYPQYIRGATTVRINFNGFEIEFTSKHADQVDDDEYIKEGLELMKNTIATYPSD